MTGGCINSAPRCTCGRSECGRYELDGSRKYHWHHAVSKTESFAGRPRQGRAHVQPSDGLNRSAPSNHVAILAGSNSSPQADTVRRHSLPLRHLVKRDLRNPEGSGQAAWLKFRRASCEASLDRAFDTWGTDAGYSTNDPGRT